MKKILVLLVITTLACTGIELKAMKGLRKPAVAVQTKVPGAVQGRVSKELTEQEKSKIRAEISKLNEGVIVKMARLRGSSEDALAFLNEVDLFIDEVVLELGKAAADDLKRTMPSNGEAIQTIVE